MPDHNSVWNYVWNGVAISTIVTSIAGFIPTFAALIAAGYYGVQIWESETVRRWRAERRAKKIAVLKAKLQSLEAHDPVSILLQKTP